MNEYVEKINSVVKGRIAIFIDTANLEQSVKDMFVRADDIPDNLKNLPTDSLRWAMDYKN
jgi:hypothetical protein